MLKSWEEEGFAGGLWWFIGLPTETVGTLFLGGCWQDACGTLGRLGFEE
jgi:hypothetical protein